MYKNLLAEMSRSGVSKEDIAKCLGLAGSTIWARFRGEPAFTVVEAVKIKNEFFPNLTLDYLFDT